MLRWSKWVISGACILVVIFFYVPSLRAQEAQEGMVFIPGGKFHYIQIKLEKEFTILSSNKHMEHHFIQAFEIPNTSCFGVQFHPEFQHQEFLTFIKTYRDLILELGLDYEEIVSKIKDFDPNAKLLRNFIQLFTE